MANFAQAARMKSSARQSAGARAGVGSRGVSLFATPGGLASPAPVHFPSDPNSIVTVNVHTIIAPTPNTYQQTGCLVSFGATSLKTQEVQLLTQREDLEEVLSPDVPVTALTWNAGLVTCTVGPGGPAWVAGDTPVVTIAGCVPAAYNGAQVQATIITPTSFTYTSATLSTDPGQATTMGTVQLSSASELGQMATTFFAQGNSISVYVLELGAQNTPSAMAALLETWLGINPRSFYGYLLPRSVAPVAAYLERLREPVQAIPEPGGDDVFLAHRHARDDGIFSRRDVQVRHPDGRGAGGHRPCQHRRSDGRVQYGGDVLQRHDLPAQQTNPIAPMAFKFVYGVTSYPTQNNGPLLRSASRTTPPTTSRPAPRAASPST